ncbi:MarR family winged helix-turn-helix transcriptional regulator [Pelagibacterium lentulum]|uniref:MarR family transcriptional regulator n=1 Tax=Pelagibacterium lentulum TaxID=2029865 RepID=A0A916RDG6_9HYPH|nr:MarR family transcriptional regulator [Pelagibacterium lentulum]GGA51774.1 hypothetical protein GCM10011499_22260 [Pelagibacterium lentulum]
MTKKLSQNHKPTAEGIDQLLELIGLFREQHPMMPMQMAHTFLLIARYPGIRASELIDITGLSQPSVSRNVAALTKLDSNGSSGLSLIKRTLCPEDPRVHRLKLTKKGKQFLSEITGVTQENNGLFDNL